MVCNTASCRTPPSNQEGFERLDNTPCCRRFDLGSKSHSTSSREEHFEDRVIHWLNNVSSVNMAATDGTREWMVCRGSSISSAIGTSRCMRTNDDRLVTVTVRLKCGTMRHSHTCACPRHVHGCTMKVGNETFSHQESNHATNVL